MPVYIERRPVYRQPWFWGALLAALALLLFTIMIAATNRPAERQVTVVTPTPEPPERTRVVAKPVPVPGPTRTEVVEKRVPVPVVKEKPVVVEKPVPVPVPAERREAAQEPAPASGERPERDTAAPTESTPAPEGLYEDTRLPQQLAFDNRIWEAREQVAGIETKLLTRSDQSIDGRAVYRERLDNRPYDRVYLKVEGREDRFVVYEPAESQ